MSSENIAHDEQVQEIDHIEIDMLGNDEKRRMSAIKSDAGIDNPEMYESGQPKYGGLVDTRMGTSDPHIDCSGCGLNLNGCVGHPGHIKLANYVFDMDNLPFIKKILDCICIRCSKVLIHKNKSDIEEALATKTGDKRMAALREITKNIKYCQGRNYGCGAQRFKIKVENSKKTSSIQVVAEASLAGVAGEEDNKKKIRRILSAEDCYNILKNISDDDCRMLGMNPTKSRPEMMLIKYLLVAPVPVRPSARAEFLASSTREDDLTVKYADIIKANTRVKETQESQGESSARYRIDYDTLLQYHVATLTNNDSVTMPRSEQKGKAIKSVNLRLKGKEGRFRSNLMGKRVDFSGRTVITPDPTIETNQLGVPLMIAMNLTKPIVVTENNIEKLTELVRNGRNKYPGANFVFQTSKVESGRPIYRIDLRYGKDRVILRYGDVVERHLVTGDIVLLNRQPTLHKLSMMGFYIKVLDDPNLLTFRLPVSSTTSFNADFDKLCRKQED